MLWVLLYLGLVVVAVLSWSHFCARFKEVVLVDIPTPELRQMWTDYEIPDDEFFAEMRRRSQRP